MLDDAVARAILDAVDENFDAQLRFTQALVRFPSLRGAEATAQDFLHDAMRERGLAVERFRIDPETIRHHPGFSPVSVSYDNAFNVVGTWRPASERGRSLILNGHVDVVPTGPADMWSRPPFEPVIGEGWMSGRGSADMKSGLAANLFALDAIRRAGFAPAARIHVQSVVEEECTGNGTLACLLQGYRADAVLIPEPEDELLVRANAGVLWFRVKVRGEPAHTRVMAAGANAIDAAYRIIAALRELEARSNAEAPRPRYFEHLPHPLNLNIGMIRGGDWASTVPPWCEFDARWAFYPGVGAAAVRAEVSECVQAAAARDPFLREHPPEIVFNGFSAEGYVLPEGTAAEAALCAAHRRVFDRELQSFTSPAYLDARVYMIYGSTPALVYGPTSERIHGFDERVEIASVRRITKTMALFVADWCGVATA